MLNAMVDINLVCGLASWVMVEQSLLGRYSILTLKGGSYSLKVLGRLLTVALPMVLLCYVAASESSFAVKQCIISGFQQPVLFLLSPLESWLLEICSTSMLTRLFLLFFTTYTILNESFFTYIIYYICYAKKLFSILAYSISNFLQLHVSHSMIVELNH